MLMLYSQMTKASRQKREQTCANIPDPLVLLGDVPSPKALLAWWRQKHAQPTCVSSTVFFDDLSSSFPIMVYISSLLPTVTSLPSLYPIRIKLSPSRQTVYPFFLPCQVAVSRGSGCGFSLYFLACFFLLALISFRSGYMHIGAPCLGDEEDHGHGILCIENMPV